MIVATILKNRMIRRERRGEDWGGLNWIEHTSEREDEMLLNSGDFNLLRFALFVRGEGVGGKGGIRF